MICMFSSFQLYIMITSHTHMHMYILYSLSLSLALISLTYLGAIRSLQTSANITPFALESANYSISLSLSTHAQPIA